MSFEGRYPEKFSLPHFQVRRDQGSRGTCAAFSAVAMLEYLRENKEAFSPQYIYAATHLSEEMRNQEGTELGEIFKAVKEKGVCLYDQWPYNKVKAGEEAQISEELFEKIPVVTFDDVTFEPLKTDPPVNVDEYKSVLCGANGNRPSPVSVGCMLFEGALSEKNSWLTLPASGFVPPVGLHAMTIYGWCDTPGMISKGYFRAANSWQGAFDIKIPYEYIERYAAKAFCMVIPAEAAEETPAAAEESAPVCSCEEKSPAAPEKSSDFSAAESVMEKFFKDQQSNFHGDYPSPASSCP